MTLQTRRPRLTARLIAIFAVSAALTLAGTTAAHASPAEDELQTCWIDIATDEGVCVDYGEDLVAAVAAQAGVSLQIPDGAIIDDEVYDSPEQPSASISADPIARASTVLGILYDDVSYGGGSLVLAVSGSCGTYTYSNLNNYGWNDRASSFRAYAGCKGTVFENELMVGAQYGPTTLAPQLYGMNDKASSFRVAP
jgi:hypothetical protein